MRKYVLSYRIFILFFSCLILLSNTGSAQIENLVVESYYVADANDATDTTQGRSLVTGMKTYRIYLDLAAGSKLTQLFGSDIHPIRITSTSDFYNNIDRPNSSFGFQMNKAWFDDNPTIALDSWLTLGLAAIGHLGVNKAADTDGSFSEIVNNLGGTANIPSGLLRNTDPVAGLPLATSDGYVPNPITPGQWLDVGFKDLAGDDSTIFGPVNTGSEFLSYNALLQQTDGIESPENNRVLIAQLTTLGELSFNLNVVIDEWNGSSYNTVTYVANGDSLLTGQVVSPFLSYPSVCGCTDPDYLEFSTGYACSVQDSCQTPVMFGCMDTLACNYDPQANYNLQSLCCYPGFCNDRDLSVVCPVISNGRFAITNLHPNPADDLIILSVGNFDDAPVSLTIYNAIGQKMLFKDFGVIDETVNVQVDVSDLPRGVYHILMQNGEESDNIRFVISE